MSKVCVANTGIIVGKRDTEKFLRLRIVVGSPNIVAAKAPACWVSDGPAQNILKNPAVMKTNWFFRLGNEQLSRVMAEMWQICLNWSIKSQHLPQLELKERIQNYIDLGKRGRRAALQRPLARVSIAAAGKVQSLHFKILFSQILLLSASDVR